MSDLVKNRGQFKPGQSGNRNGRPREGTSASEINRGLMKRYGSWDRLARVAAGLCPLTQDEQAARIAAGKAPYPEPSITEMLRALELQAAYGFGRPTQTVEGIEGLLTKAGGITIIKNYVDKQIVQNNVKADVRVGIADAPHGPVASDERSAPVQLLPDGPALGKIDAGPEPDRGHRD